MTTINTQQVSDDLMASANGTKSAVSSTGETQDRFLKLLVTQMKNQDPLNPMDNAAVTSQMAQLSTVTGIDKLNASVNTLIASSQSSQSMQASSVIGHGIFTRSSTIKLKGESAQFGVNLGDAAGSVSIQIKNAAGTAIRTVDLGSLDAGTHGFTWDGKDNSGAVVPAADYKVSVVAQNGGVPVTATTLAYGVVTSVSTGAQGIKVNTDTRSDIAFNDILQIL